MCGKREETSDFAGVLGAYPAVPAPQSLGFVISGLNVGLYAKVVEYGFRWVPLEESTVFPAIKDALDAVQLAALMFGSGAHKQPLGPITIMAADVIPAVVVARALK